MSIFTYINKTLLINTLKPINQSLRLK